MLGRKTYTQQELDSAAAAVEAQLAAWRALDGAAPAEVEPTYFNALLLALDRPFVHRLRTVTGKDTNPLSELELLVDSLIDNGGVLATGSVVKYQPEKAVLGLQPGDRIALTADQFERLSTAVLDRLRERFAAA